MIKKIVLVLLLLNFLDLFSVNSNRKTIEGNYYGFWGATIWYYKFTHTKEFYYKSEGHFGLTHSQGHYNIKGDSLFLFPDSSMKTVLKLSPSSQYFNHNVTFIIDGDSCIYDTQTMYDYCKIGTKIAYIEKNDTCFQHSRRRK